MGALPAHLIQAATAALSQSCKQPVTIRHAEPVSGGCIHQAQRLHTSAGTFFIKFNRAGELPNFQAEMAGLRLLREAGPLPTPQPLHAGLTAPHQGEALAFLLMSHIATGVRQAGFWPAFGRRLAALHRRSAPKFGLDHANFIGRLPQSNATCRDWPTFFQEQRLAPQLALAEQNGLADHALRGAFERLYARLPDLIPEAPPSLLHGDLWSGNFMVGEDGQAVLVDPAVYFGHREAEIAFTQLFGGFAPEFYAAYNAAWPLEKGWETRVDLFNLYPLAVHLNLFGRSYLPEIQAVLRKYT